MQDNLLWKPIRIRPLPLSAPVVCHMINKEQSDAFLDPITERAMDPDRPERKYIGVDSYVIFAYNKDLLPILTK